MTNARRYIFPTVKVEINVTGSESCQLWPHARSIGSDREANGGFHIITRDPLQGITEPEFLISSQGLGHVTPNFLAK